MIDWLRHLSAEGWAALIALIALTATIGGATIRVVYRHMFTRVKVDLFPRGEPGSYEFVITNTGAVAARDVDLRFGLIPDGHREPIFITSGRQPFPIASLAAGQQVAVPTMLVLAVPSSFEAELRWTDRADTNRS